MPNTQCYAYIRTSTVRQGTEGVSLDAQREAIEVYARRQNIEVVEWFCETQTAAKRGRPIFSRMMRSLSRRKVDGLILHRIDRGSRNLKDWSDIADLSDLGLQVHFAHDAIDLTTRGGRLAADVQAVVAADFIRNLRDEALKGMLGRVKQGLLPFAAPLGYVDRGKAKVKTIDAVHGPVVRKAFELYASGRYSYDTLSDELFNLGLRNRAGRRVSLDGLTRMFNNPFYCGWVRWPQTGELFAGLHDALISQSLFDEVQDVLHGRVRKRSLRHDHIYRRDITCAACGRKLVGETQKGHVYYRCHSKGCRNVSVREERVTEALRRDLYCLGRFMESCPGLAERLEVAIERGSTHQKERVASLRLTKASLDARLDLLTDALVDGIVDREAFLKRKNGLLKDIARIDENIAVEEAEEAPPDCMAFQYLELLKHIQDKAFLESATKARDICKSVSSNFLVSQKNVELQWVWPFDVVINRARTTDGVPTRDTGRTSREIAEMFLSTVPGPTSRRPDVPRLSKA
jgi:site-specific DNA recombinase